ncbi:hypothetical protein LCGC14_0641390 [marine sediment metagenome]|uniref:Uncharacterized protein n=1 Tax=marine sediment metagenome TaxID=412755 RepID=A0A0F9R462_9ZZZZ
MKLIRIIGIIGIVMSVAFENIYTLLGLGFLLLLESIEDLKH